MIQDRDVEQVDHAVLSMIWEAEGYWKATSTTTTARTSTGLLTPNNQGSGYDFAPVITWASTFTGTNTIRIQQSSLGIDWQWSGSMTSGNTLTVDCGAFTVDNNGSDAYSGMTFNSGHTSSWWMYVPSGSGNAYTFTLTAGTGTFTIVHYDTWV